MNRRNFLKATGSGLMALGLMGLPRFAQTRIAKAESPKLTLLAKRNNGGVPFTGDAMDSLDWQTVSTTTPGTLSALTLLEKMAHNTDAEEASNTIPDWVNDDLTYNEQQMVGNLNNYMERYDFNQYNSSVYVVNNVYFYGVDHVSGTNICTAFYEDGRNGLRHLANRRYPMIWGPVLAGLAFASEDWDHYYYSPFEGLFPALFNYVMGQFDRSSEPYISETAAGNTYVGYQADPATRTGIISVVATDESDILLGYDYKVGY